MTGDERRHGKHLEGEGDVTLDKWTTIAGMQRPAKMEPGAGNSMLMCSRRDMGPSSQGVTKLQSERFDR
jgi:hypothetical protein